MLDGRQQTRECTEGSRCTRGQGANYPFIYMQSTFLILFFITRSMADQHFQMKLDSIRAGAGATNPLAVK